VGEAWSGAERASKQKAAQDPKMQCEETANRLEKVGFLVLGVRGNVYGDLEGKGDGEELDRGGKLQRLLAERNRLKEKLNLYEQ
jgi:hypothetical protein